MGLNNVSALKEFLARVTAAPGTSGETPKVVMLDNLHRVSKLDDVFEVCGHNADQVSQYGAISNRIAPSTNAKSNYLQAILRSDQHHKLPFQFIIGTYDDAEETGSAASGNPQAGQLQSPTSSVVGSYNFR